MKTTIPETTVGIDLGDKKHAICAIDSEGELIEQRPITNHRESIRRLSQKYPEARMVMEVGTHSPWISRFLSELGHEVFVANARKLRAIYANNRKSDEADAHILARLGRFDTSLLYPIQHGSEQAQRDMLQIKLRDNLVRQRVDIISAVRFTLKSLGLRIKSPSTPSFARHARKVLAERDEDLLKMIEPSLDVLDVMNDQIKHLDKKIEILGVEQYPESQRLRQISGVGPITSLAFVLLMGDLDRFSSSRAVGAYLGLVPKRDQSGNLDKKLPISKAGDAYMRRLLVGAAQYILGPFGSDCDLRRHGLELAERGGRGAKKKAVIATARKLAVLMHALLLKDREYQPLAVAA